MNSGSGLGADYHLLLLISEIELAIFLIISLIGIIIGIIWAFVIILKKINIRRRQHNLIKFHTESNPYHDNTNIIEELRVQNKILHFPLLVILIEIFMVTMYSIGYSVKQYCLREYIQQINSSCYVKDEINSYMLYESIGYCIIQPLSFLIAQIITLFDFVLFTSGVFYIKALLANSKSPLKSNWKHITILACAPLSFILMSTNPPTQLFSNLLYGILLQIIFVYSVVAARTLYRQLEKQQRDLVHFNRPDRYNIIQSIERLKKRFKLILIILYSSVQASIITYYVFSICQLLQEIAVNTCQIEYYWNISLHLNTTPHATFIINKLADYSNLINSIVSAIMVLNLIFLNILYGLQALIHYCYRSKKRIYRYNMGNLFNPKLGQPLLKDYDRAKHN